MKKEEIKQRLKEIKSEKKELKKQLAELPKLFEVGKWYKYSTAIICYSGTPQNYGFTFSGKWTTEFYSNNLSLWTEATEDEVFEALKYEAIKRGFKEGDKISRDWSSLKPTLNGNISSYYESLNTLDVGGWQVFRNGVWATIIKEPTIELNGEYTKVQLTDIINNKF